MDKRLKMTSEMKICPQYYQLYVEKEECLKCRVELDTIEKFAADADRLLEHHRGLHTLYVDPSYAEISKTNYIKDYYKIYMTLLKADYQNREKYLYGLAKTYDIFDQGRDYTHELDRIAVREILSRLLEFNPKKLEYLRLKVIYLYIWHEYEDSVKYYEKILEMGIEDEWCKAYY